ncbi:uncharacterized protein LOC143565948 [Bidens hawaiensis]|uniref:uncharacterized protein LOC143565948 n=1 Tax=Bidens hawaiensis TaxID=980011 RepID=UPI00404A8FA6
MSLKSPTNVKEVQRLTGRVVALNRFISKSLERGKDFYDILRKNKKFEWMEKHEAALTALSDYLSSAPALMKPVDGEPLILYLAISLTTLSAVLIKDHEGRMAKWAVILSAYDIQYEPRNAIKSQALAEFVADFSSDIEEQANLKVDILPHSIACEFQATNNEAEYEALIAVKGEKLIKYLDIVKDLLGSFDYFNITQVPREENARAEALANLASALKLPENIKIPIIHVLSLAIEEYKALEVEGKMLIDHVDHPRDHSS